MSILPREKINGLLGEKRGPIGFSVGFGGDGTRAWVPTSGTARGRTAEDRDQGAAVGGG